jgi:cathepsin D
MIVIVDTGSADLWIPSSDCSLTACKKHIQYNPSTSLHASSTGESFKIKYGSGSVGGYVFTDSLTLGDFFIPEQRLGTVVSLSKNFEDEPFDGILGLGFNSLTALSAKTPLDHLFESMQISSKKFSLFLDHENGKPSELLFNGINENLYTGEFTTLPLSSDLGYWMVQLDGVSVVSLSAQHNQSFFLDFPENNQVIMDTGTTLIMAPKKAAKRLHSFIPGARKSHWFSKFYVFPCQNVENISIGFVLGGKTFYLSKNDFVLGTTDHGKTCMSAIQSSKNNEWILGGSFLRNVYSVWDAEAKTLSLADVKRN